MGGRRRHTRRGPGFLIHTTRKSRSPAGDPAPHCRLLGGCNVGAAKVTPGFRLDARWVIHTAGPQWRDGTHGEPELLASCYRESLARADEVGARSVAFPAISTGVYGYPASLAADVAVETIRSTRTPVQLVRLVCFDDDSERAVAAAMTWSRRVGP